MRRIWATSMLLVASTACAADGADGPSRFSDDSPAETDRAMSDPRASGVGIVAEGCSLVAQLGSGAAVAEPGRVVTSAHTVAGALTITVIDTDGIEHAAIVVGFDKDADLAALDVPSLDAPPLALAAGVTLGPGAFVSWTRDDGVIIREVTVSKRLAVTIEDIYTDETVERSGIEVVGDIRVGDSGGAVADADGNLVGVAYASSRSRDDIGFASDRHEVAELLAAVDLATIDVGGVDNGRCL